MNSGHILKVFDKSKSHLIDLTVVKKVEMLFYQLDLYVHAKIRTKLHVQN